MEVKKENYRLIYDQNGWQTLIFFAVFTVHINELNTKIRHRRMSVKMF
jgi:hypothetical protein